MDLFRFLVGIVVGVLVMSCQETESWTPTPNNPKRWCRTSLLASKEIYGVPGSRWGSPTWNWGYARGTGHDCAAICRKRYSSRRDRQKLIETLLAASSENVNSVDVEELKLILGLMFQRGRWDGSDGGSGGYEEVLSAMAQAKRYEDKSDEVSQERLLRDMAERFHLIVNWMGPGEEKRKMFLELMQNALDMTDTRAGLAQCSGLVLQTMGFVENGL